MWGLSRVRTQEHLSTACLLHSSNPDSTSHTEAFQTRDPALLGLISTLQTVSPSPSLLGPQAQGTLVGQGGWACPEEARVVGMDLKLVGDLKPSSGAWFLGRLGLGVTELLRV